MHSRAFLSPRFYRNRARPIPPHPPCPYAPARDLPLKLRATASDAGALTRSQRLPRSDHEEVKHGGCYGTGAPGGCRAIALDLQHPAANPTHHAVRQRLELRARLLERRAPLHKPERVEEVSRALQQAGIELAWPKRRGFGRRAAALVRGTGGREGERPSETLQEHLHLALEAFQVAPRARPL